MVILSRAKLPEQTLMNSPSLFHVWSLLGGFDFFFIVLFGCLVLLLIIFSPIHVASWYRISLTSGGQPPWLFPLASDFKYL